MLPVVPHVCLMALLGLWTLVYAAVLIEATKRLRLDALRTAARPTPGQQWLIVRPLSGTPRDLGLLTTLPQSAERLIVLFLAANDDPSAQGAARAAVGLLRAQGQPAQMVITAPAGPNGKAAQLAQIPGELLQDSWVLSLDDDVDAASVHLNALQAALQQDSTLGAVWLPFMLQDEARTWADALAAQVINCSPHALRVLAVLGPNNVTGKVLAYRPDHVAAAGGWGPRVRFYGDDLDLGQALSAAGFGVMALSQHPARAQRLGQSWREVWQRHRRWCRIIVDQKRILVPSYFWLMGGAPLLVGAWAGVWGECEAPRTPALALVSIALVLGMRLQLFARLSGAPWVKWPWNLVLALAADALVVAACVAALASPMVSWRGRIDRVHR